MEKHADVDEYLAQATRWRDETVALRALLLDEGLDESLKRGKPSYVHAGGNVAIVQRMKNFLALLFFKCVLLDDPLDDSHDVLRQQGANTRSARRLCFMSASQLRESAPVHQGLARSAIAVEEARLTAPDPPPLVLALVLIAELQNRLDGDPSLAAAFEDLTPGRWREYHLFASGAKRSSTRVARVEKHVDRIRAGKGLRDR